MATLNKAVLMARTNPVKAVKLGAIISLEPNQKTQVQLLDGGYVIMTNRIDSGVVGSKVLIQGDLIIGLASGLPTSITTIY
jgi:hypothetical protein